MAVSLIALAGELTAGIDADDIEAAADLLLETYRADGVVLACGNGGSASTASHFAADVTKLTIVDGARRVRSLCLNDNIAGTTAWANDAGFAATFAEQAHPWLDESSTLVVFSVHGGARDRSVSSNLADVCTLARTRSASIIGVTGFDGGVLADDADVHINLPAYREPLATPGIESVQVLVHHAICLALRERIAALGGRGCGPA